MHPDEVETLIKVPPHSTEAEQSLLGALLLDNQAFDRVAWLDSNAFYEDRHRRLWRALARLLEAGKGADIITVADALGDDLEKVGGVAYVAALAQNTPSALNIHRYADLVRSKATLRDLAQRSIQITEKALDGTSDPMELVEEAAAAFLAVQGQTERGEAVPFGQATVEAIEAEDNPVKGLNTGYPELDRIVNGLKPGDLVIIAGRPSMGKTALAMNIAEHVAAREPVAVLSLEMTRRKIAGRALRYHESRVGRERATEHLYGLKMHIDDSSALTVGQARARLRKVQRAHGLKLVVIDYLQMMTGKGENRTQEVSAISRGLKAIAKDLNVAVIAVAQLNRGAEARVDSRPMLSDLRESGQIEQDADVIAFVYREDYYKPETPWRGIAEVIVRKNRDGGVGTAYLSWVPEYTRFLPHEGPLPRPEAPEPEKPRHRVVRVDFKDRAAGGEG